MPASRTSGGGSESPFTSRWGGSSGPSHPTTNRRSVRRSYVWPGSSTTMAPYRPDVSCSLSLRWGGGVEGRRAAPALLHQQAHRPGVGTILPDGAGTGPHLDAEHESCHVAGYV